MRDKINLLLVIISIFSVSIAMAKTVDPLKNPALNPVRAERAPQGAPVTLVRDGLPTATVVIAEAAYKSQQSTEWVAARELVEHLRLATGATLPVVSDARDTAGTLVLLGESRLTRDLKITAQGVRPEGFRVQTFPGGLAIVGWKAAAADGGVVGERGARSTIFGVYDVLERFVGVRWYYPGDDGRIIPAAGEITIAPVHYTDAPVRIYRRMDGWDYMHALRYRDGLSTTVSLACHTPHNFGMHFAEAPECFEQDRDGQRNKFMPCYGNPKTVDYMIQDLVNYYEKGITTPWLHPNMDGSLWQVPTATTIHISPPDKAVECHCDYCKALTDPKSSGYATASQVMGNFVVKMAKEIKKRWPEKTVFFLPYANYTEAPKGLKIPDNVVVGICLMRGAANQKEKAIEREHDKFIREWAKLTGGRVRLWEYLCWPGEDTALPFQYPHVLKSFQQRYRKSLEGSYINGPSGPPGLPGGQWAFQTPTIYCWYRVMWNPDFNVDAALAEYVELMYGPAKKPMGDILSMLIDRWEKTRWSVLPTRSLVSPKMVHEETMPRKEALRLKALLAEARALAPAGSVYERRVNFQGNALDLFFVESDLYHDGTGLPTLRALKVGGNPLMDGKLDDPCWREAEAQPFKPEFDRNALPQHGTTVQAVWSPNGVTFGFRLQEPHMDRILAKCTLHDQAVYSDDCIEVFLDVEGQRQDYYQIISNSIGTLFDIRRRGEWDTVGTRGSVHKGEDFWSLELYVPFSDFTPKPAVTARTQWFVNFTRTRMVNPTREIQRWSTLGRGSNHDFNAFGRLHFVE